MANASQQFMRRFGLLLIDDLKREKDRIDGEIKEAEKEEIRLRRKANRLAKKSKRLRIELAKVERRIADEKRSIVLS